MRLLIANAYARDGREALRSAGATAPDALYRRLVERVAPGTHCDVIYPADADAELPSGAGLREYDGIVWTGSSLTIHADADDRVRRQIDFTRAAFAAAVPSFGSCWAAQISVVAAGGRCAPNPRGREFGVTAAIRLQPAGRAHPLYRGKPTSFVALTSHADEVVALPPGATLLASNEFSAVQSVAVDYDGGSFWAVQYHPEYDIHEIARLCVLRAEELIRQGTFADAASAAAYIDALERVFTDPTQTALAHEYGVDAPDLNAEQRSVEFDNWIGAMVAPRAAARGR